MQPINDQNIIKHRVGMQELRDMRVGELTVFAFDLRERIEIRRLNTIPEISEIDSNYLKELVAQIASVHFELLYAKTWLSMSEDYRSRVVDNAVKKLLEVIKSETLDNILSTIAMTVVALIENELRNNA